MVTVSAAGVITGKAPGTTNIVAKLGKLTSVSVPVQVEGEVGTWKKSGGKWWFQLDDGSYPYNQWAQIDGDWYYFDRSGYMQTGWLKLGKSWYYLKSSGAMAKGWYKVGGKWYYSKSSGAMQANRWIGNYYVTGSGAMATNTWIGRYHVNTSGLWDRTR